jgi:LysR family glycine cleavage system transcriptional activator
MSRLPPLNSVRVFDAVVRAGSFAKAASELGMTRAAVGYHIRVLEDRLRTALFERKADGATLTPSGSRCAPRVAVALRELRRAFDEIGQSEPKELSVSAVTNFGQQWLMPRLADFQKQFGIKVRLETTASITDLNRDGYDVAIRNGYGSWPGMRADHLIPLTLTPLVARQAAERIDLKAGPRSLLDLPLYCLNSREWASWFGEVGVRADLLQESELHEWDCWHLVGQAAINGLGAALLFPFLYQRELAAGALVQPFPQHIDIPYGYWIVYPEDRSTDRAIQCFARWLQDEIDPERGMERSG